MAINTNGADWREIEAWAKQQRSSSVDALIASSSHEASQYHRGCIEQIDELLTLPNRKKPDPAQGANSYT
jgi:hypothetical protein